MAVRQKRSARGVQGRSPAAVLDPRSHGALCDVCPLNGKSRCVWGKGPRLAKVAVVGEGPGLNEVDIGVPFVGAAGEVLEEIAAAYKIQRSEMYVDNATMEMPPGGNLDKFLQHERFMIRRAAKKGKDADGTGGKMQHPADCCRPRLFRALGIPKCSSCGRHRLGKGPCKCLSPLWVYPEGMTAERAPVIVPLGNAALRSLLGVEGIMAWQSSVLDVDMWRQGAYTRPVLSEEIRL